jgi:hypothetical protein
MGLRLGGFGWASGARQEETERAGRDLGQRIERDAGDAPWLNPEHAG